VTKYLNSKFNGVNGVAFARHGATLFTRFSAFLVKSSFGQKKSKIALSLPPMGKTVEIVRHAIDGCDCRKGVT
jgi:hypothetical protein